ALAELLSLSGHRVTLAGSVEEGLAAAAAGALDLVVSDLGLPDGSGLDLMRELARRHGLKGIALSGSSLEEDVASSRAAGFSLHQTNPTQSRARGAAMGGVGT